MRPIQQNSQLPRLVVAFQEKLAVRCMQVEQRLFFRSAQVRSAFWATKFLPQLTNPEPQLLLALNFPSLEDVSHLQPFAVLLHQIVVFAAKYDLLPQTQQPQKWQ